MLPFAGNVKLEQQYVYTAGRISEIAKRKGLEFRFPFGVSPPTFLGQNEIFIGGKNEKSSILFRSDEPNFAITAHL